MWYQPGVKLRMQSAGHQPGLGQMGVESREQHPSSKLLRPFLAAHYGFLGISPAAVLILQQPMIPPIVTLRFQPKTHFLTFPTSSRPCDEAQGSPPNTPHCPPGPLVPSAEVRQRVWHRVGPCTHLPANTVGLGWKPWLPEHVY